jgi:thiazole/oxazole-forming peptide maturase SagD family component
MDVFMNDSYYPISAVPATPNVNGIHFQPPRSRGFTVRNHVDLIWSILAECNGCKSAKAIIVATHQKFPAADVDLIEAIADRLSRIGVLVDVREAWKPFHDLTCRPTALGDRSLASEAGCLASQSALGRQQFAITHAFTRKGLSLGQINAILRSVGRRSVGAERSVLDQGSLRIHAILAIDQAGMTRGYYQYDLIRRRLVRVRDIDIQQLRYAFNSDSLLGGAPAMIAIAIHLRRRSGANDSRGYRIALIEVGRTVQDIVSAAVKCDLSAFQCTEFLDRVLAEELGLTVSQAQAPVLPVAVVAIGHPDRDEQVTTEQQLAILRHALVGKSMPVKEAWIGLGLRPDEEQFPFFSAYSRARLSGPGGRTIISGGTGSSTDEALLKAIAEGYERYETAQCRVECSAAAATFTRRGDTWLDPRNIAPLTSNQYKLRPDLRPFDARCIWQWVRGRKMVADSPIWIPVDLVFTDLNSDRMGRRPCAYATSSGVAAAFSEQKATERAVLELIERHALMRSWLERKPPTRIDPTALTYHCQRRIEYWRKQHRNIYVLDLSSLGVAVATVIIVSDTYPCFVAGAAASIIEFEEAAIKALREAELLLAQWTMRPTMRPIEPELVRNALDHARLYSGPEYISRLSWLWAGQETRTVPIASANIDELHEKLRTITVDLSPETSPLKVVRVLSPELIPLSFGYGLAHHTHPAVGRVSRNSVLMPHYFA